MSLWGIRITSRNTGSMTDLVVAAPHKDAAEDAAMGYARDLVYRGHQTTLTGARPVAGTDPNPGVCQVVHMNRVN